MSASAAAFQQTETLFEYQHPRGAKVTHMRGLVLMNSQKNLQAWGLYQDYLDLLTPEARPLLQSTLASSWVPIEDVMLHYAVAEQLGITHAQVDEAADRLARQVAKLYLLSQLRARLCDGFDVVTSVLGRNGRMWERMYQGGGCRVLRTGEREVEVVDEGIPLARFALFRRAHGRYLRTFAQLFAPDCRVLTQPPRPDGALSVRFRAR